MAPRNIPNQFLQVDDATIRAGIAQLQGEGKTPQEIAEFAAARNIDPTQLQRIGTAGGVGAETQPLLEGAYGGVNPGGFNPTTVRAEDLPTVTSQFGPGGKLTGQTVAPVTPPGPIAPAPVPAPLPPGPVVTPPPTAPTAPPLSLLTGPVPEAGTAPVAPAATTFAPTTDISQTAPIVTPEVTVAEQLRSILASDSPLLQQAEARAAEKANRFSLLSSSLAVGEAERELAKTAIPIAQQDAATVAQSLLSSQQALQDQALTAQQGTISSQLQREQAGTQIGLAAFEAEQQRNLVAQQAIISSQLQREEAQLAETFAQNRNVEDVQEEVRRFSQEIGMFERGTDFSREQAQIAHTQSLETLQTTFGLEGQMTTIEGAVDLAADKGRINAASRQDIIDGFMSIATMDFSGMPKAQADALKQTYREELTQHYQANIEPLNTTIDQILGIV